MKQHLRRLLAAVGTLAMLTTAASALSVEQAVDLLEEYYVDDLPQAAYEAETLDELFAAVGDPYTFYMTEEEYQAFLGSVEGSEEQVGIGVAVSYTDAGIEINTVLPGGAAEAGGLVAGDVIIAIDGESCVPAKESDVTRIAGEEGTQVAITVRRADGSTRTFQLTRSAFTLPTTETVLLEGGIGYIDCDSFASTTGTMVSSGVSQYDEEADLWLVDLRGNLGGVTNAAVEAAGVFTGAGFLLYLRDGSDNYYPYVYLENYQTGDPVIVLTDLYSASASEVFASAIKDYGAGIVVGNRTYGKGVAQIVLDETTNPELFDGDAVKITAYRFYSGAGNTTDGVGVLPTLLIHDELVNDVALLLCTQEPEDTEGWIRLTLGGWYFYVDVDEAKASDEGTAALSELFAALPPSAPVGVFLEGNWIDLNAVLAAPYLEINYESRWFTDVAGSPYAEELNTLATYGILQGAGDGTFLPEATLTRAELCALLAQALDRISTSASPFSDVSDERWYAPYITAMYEMGLVEGRGDGTFGPNDTLTQEEFAAILGRLAEFLSTNCHEALKAVTEEDLTDPALDGWADWAKEYAWLLGLAYQDQEGRTHSMLYTDLDQVDPQATVLREEAGASLYGVLTTLGVLSF